VNGFSSAVIASRENQRVAGARRLQLRKHRERERRFLIEGPHGLEEALASSAPVVELFHVWDGAGKAVERVVATARERGIPCAPVTRQVLAALDSTETPQGVVAVCERLDVGLESIAPGLVPVLVEVQDPGNLGTILRSADAAGAEGVVVTTGSVDLYNAKAVRASAGSMFHVPVVRDVSPNAAVRALRSAGARIVAASSAGRDSVHRSDLTGHVAILFGNEARGLPDEVMSQADTTVRVPIHERAESLNLSAAAAVVLFEAARQRGEAR
jgi:TrmH family RNA methyltransferase